MDGEIWVQSQINKGSDFVYTLFFTEDSEPSDSKEVQKTDRVPDFRDIQILLAEDNEINQEVAKGILELTHCSIIVANNGQEAVEAVASNSQIDLVLMDVQMPVMNGFDATRKIRESEGDKERLPIIAMTGAAMDADRVHAIESGMDAFIAKPFSLEELYSELTKWIKTSKMGFVN